MGMKVKAMERNIAFNKDKEPVWGFVMQAEFYGQLSEDKAIEQAAQASGLSKGVIQASMIAYGSVLKTWATEGHSVPIPGLGCMRFGLRSNSVDDVSKVSTSLITARRVIFIPSVDVKKALAETSISITCYDRNGVKLKTVNSSDKDDVEDNENTGGGGSQGGGSSTPSGGGSGTGSGSGDSGQGGSNIE